MWWSQKECIKIFLFVTDEQIINRVNLGIRFHKAVNKLGKLDLFAVFEGLAKVQGNQFEEMKWYI